MNILKTAVLCAAFTILGSGVFAATSGTVTIGGGTQSGALQVYTIDWTSNSDGIAYGNGDNKGLSFTGQVIKVVTDPGSTAPTDNYDIELLDEDGYDVLLNVGADRDTANTEALGFAVGQYDGFTTTAQTSITVDTSTTFYPFPVITSGKLYTQITNAGDSKVGEIKLYVLPVGE